MVSANAALTVKATNATLATQANDVSLAARVSNASLASVSGHAGLQDNQSDVDQGPTTTQNPVHSQQAPAAQAKPVADYVSDDAELFVVTDKQLRFEAEEEAEEAEEAEDEDYEIGFADFEEFGEEFGEDFEEDFGDEFGDDFADEQINRQSTYTKADLAKLDALGHNNEPEAAYGYGEYDQLEIQAGYYQPSQSATTPAAFVSANAAPATVKAEALAANKAANKAQANAQFDFSDDELDRYVSDDDPIATALGLSKHDLERLRQNSSTTSSQPANSSLHTVTNRVDSLRPKSATSGSKSQETKLRKALGLDK